MLAESLPRAPAVLPLDLHRRAERSPTIRGKPRIRNFGTMLQPRYIVGTGPLDQ